MSIRKRIRGTTARPRLVVFRTTNHIYAQVINDETSATLAAASTQDKDFKVKGHRGNKTAAAKIGELIAERAKAAGVEKVVFDRNGYLYHGRVQALADSARAGGLDF
jgi:large subunit ribosomal protein L18